MIDSNHSFPASSPPRRQTRAGKGDGVMDDGTRRCHGRCLRGSSARLRLHTCTSSTPRRPRLVASSPSAAGLLVSAASRRNQLPEPPTAPVPRRPESPLTRRTVVVPAPARIAGQRYICLLLLSSRFQYRVQTSIE
jgi:hypothetical protein